MVGYPKVSHTKILPLVDGSPPRSAKWEKLIAEEYAREMPIGSYQELRSDCRPGVG